MKVFGITGWKNSGKTTLIERLVVEFKARGLSVSTIKHAHHSVDLDQKGKDSHRHREAGAEQVMVSSHTRWALMTEMRDKLEPSLDVLIAQMSDVDLLIVEGYKRDNHAKIETFRGEAGKGLIAEDDQTIKAVASSVRDLDIDRPVFDIDDTRQIADFIAEHAERF